MKEGKKFTGTMAATVVALAAIGFAATSCEKRDVSRKSSEASVVTNENGSVSRTFTECVITTNGSMVTERRRETRTTLDPEGNMLESSTSEYAQSFSVGGLGEVAEASGPKAAPSPADKAATPAKTADSFLGLAFGEPFAGTNLVADAGEPTLLRAAFRPKKTLAGFDDYYVYVTPKTHRIVKVYACAREAIEPGANGRRHYLVEALEKRYRTWALPKSAFRPIYSFDIGGGRYITTCLEGATSDYETVIVAWDDALLTTAADESEEIRAEARKAALERRRVRVDDAAGAF